LTFYISRLTFDIPAFYAGPALLLSGITFSSRYKDLLCHYFTKQIFFAFGYDHY